MCSFKGQYNLEHKLYKESVSQACEGKSQNSEITNLFLMLL